MKNQTFGDNRDLLKFDLVDFIAGSGLIEHFTYVPMLTRDEAGREEPQFCRHNSSGGGQNQGLVAFLDNCIINEKRQIGQLEEYFKDREFQFTLYSKNTFFTHEDRGAYFAGLKGELLDSSLILIDPDKGLEEDRNGDGNLLFSELRDIFDRMSEASLLMFTQRFPYDLHEVYLGMRVAEIKEVIPGCQPISLDDQDSIIFLLTKSQSMQNGLLKLLGEYTGKYAKKCA